MLTRICTRGSRKVDIFARLGGEEFALLLPETPQQTAADLAERLRALVETTSLRSDSAKFNVTASMGVAEFGSRENDSLDRLLHRADKALYAAKAGGRNRVVIWKPEME
jgi:diguanylate cyclase (GGDEF)-like protein